MKKSELRKIIRGIIREQGPDPVEPNTGPTMYPGGTAGGGNTPGRLTPPKGTPNPNANKCCQPMKDELNNHKMQYNKTLTALDNGVYQANTSEYNTAKAFMYFYESIQHMWGKCCRGSVDVSLTGPSNTGQTGIFQTIPS